MTLVQCRDHAQQRSLTAPNVDIEKQVWLDWERSFRAGHCEDAFQVVGQKNSLRRVGVGKACERWSS
jgi:hypothetical protein